MKKEPAVNKTVLPNGVKIISKTMPYVRSVSMGVWVNAGARDEAASESGLSHFIEHMIFKGTARRTAFQIAKEFDAIGGQSNAFTSMEHTCYHAKVMDAQLTTMVDILSDIFLNSVFDAQEIEKERPIIFQEIGMVEDTPEEFVHLLAGRNFWGDHPLGRSSWARGKTCWDSTPHRFAITFNTSISQRGSSSPWPAISATAKWSTWWPPVLNASPPAAAFRRATRRARKALWPCSKRRWNKFT